MKIRDWNKQYPEIFGDTDVLTILQAKRLYNRLKNVQYPKYYIIYSGRDNKHLTRIDNIKLSRKEKRFFKRYLFFEDTLIYTGDINE